MIAQLPECAPTNVRETKWRKETLGETAQFINGVAFKPTDWGNEGLPIIRIQNLTNPGKPLNRTKRQVDPIYHVKPGDLLVSWSATLDAYLWDREPALLNQHIFKVVPNEKVCEPRFLYFLLKSAISQMSKTEHLHGSTMKHINRGPFLAHEVALPPLDEQRRIVEQLDEQFSQLDAGVAALKRAHANLKRYRASVLKAACEGRLVPTEADLAKLETRNSKFEIGQELLARILEERRRTWTGRGKYKEPAMPAIVDQPELPEGWTWATLGQLTWSVKDGPHYSPKYVDEGIPFISGGNVRPQGVDFESAKRISRDLHQELCARCKPERGDILYTKGGTTGIARVNTYDIEFNVWVHVAVLKLVRSADPFYVQHALNSPECLKQARKFTHGVGNQDLGLTRMVQIVFGVPPPAEQERIVAEVERRLSVVDQLEATITANLRRATRLRQSILQEAFAGPGAY
jgi:type I restriction enzyme S subunit